MAEGGDGDERGEVAEQPDHQRRERHDDDDDEYGRSPALPADVLPLVFASLTAVDLVRCSAVCRSWRSAVKGEGRLRARTILPWLALTRDPRGTVSCFLDVATGKTYSITLPELGKAHLVGRSDHGSLVHYELYLKRLSMINPLTREMTIFPPLSPPLDDVSQAHVVVSSSSSSTCATGYTVVISHKNGLSAAFADAGNSETWRSVSDILDLSDVRKLHVCGRKLCALSLIRWTNGSRSYELVSERYQLVTCDLDDSGIPKRSRRSDFYCDSLISYHAVLLPNGKPILVCRCPSAAVAVEVYDMSTGGMEVATSIGDYAIFLDEQCGVVLSTLGFPELKAGTIYFYSYRKDAGNPNYKDLLVFDMETRSVGAFTSHPPEWIHYKSRWFMPMM